MTGAAPGANRWLYGPGRDLLFGCGLLYAGLFVVLAVWGPEVRHHQAAYLAPLLLILSPSRLRLHLTAGLALRQPGGIGIQVLLEALQRTTVDKPQIVAYAAQ